MPILLFLLIVILIVQIGFWDTLAALLGAAAVLVLAFVILLAIAGVAGYLLVRRAGRGS